LMEQFPLFNFADVFITLGVVVLSVVLWWGVDENGKK